MSNREFDRVLVTGGTGFIGSLVLERLITRGIRPLVTTRSPRSSDYFGSSDVDLYELDITDSVRTSELIRSYKPQAVLHLAGVTGSGDPTGDLCGKVNLTATQNLFNSLDAVGVERVVTIGSAAEYGLQPLPFREEMKMRPVSKYGTSKAAATRMALEMHENNGFPVSVLRVFSAYGNGQPRHMFLPQVIEHALANRHFEMSHGKQLRDFVHVSDVAEAIIAALNTKEAVGKIINIGSGKGSALRDVAKKVWSMCEAEPDGLLIGARPTINDDDIDTEADISRAEDILGWRPQIPFIEHSGETGGLAAMVARVRSELKNSIAVEPC